MHALILIKRVGSFSLLKNLTGKGMNNAGCGAALEALYGPCVCEIAGESPVDASGSYSYFGASEGFGVVWMKEEGSGPWDQRAITVFFGVVPGPSGDGGSVKELRSATIHLSRPADSSAAENVDLFKILDLKYLKNDLKALSAPSLLFPSCLPRRRDASGVVALCLKIQSAASSMDWCDFDAVDRDLFDVLGDSFDLRAPEDIGFNHLEELGGGIGEEAGGEGLKVASFIRICGDEWWLMGCSVDLRQGSSGGEDRTWIINLQGCAGVSSPFDLHDSDLSLSPVYRKRSSLVQYLLCHYTGTIVCVDLTRGEILGQELLFPKFRGDGSYGGSSANDAGANQQVDRLEVSDTEFFLLNGTPYIVSRLFTYRIGTGFCPSVFPPPPSFGIVVKRKVTFVSSDALLVVSLIQAIDRSFTLTIQKVDAETDKGSQHGGFHPPPLTLPINTRAPLSTATTTTSVSLRLVSACNFVVRINSEYFSVACENGAAVVVPCKTLEAGMLPPHQTTTAIPGGRAAAQHNKMTLVGDKVPSVIFHSADTTTPTPLSSLKHALSSEEYSRIVAICIKSPIRLPWGVTVSADASVFCDYVLSLLRSPANCHKAFKTLKNHESNRHFDRRAVSSVLLPLLVSQSPPRVINQHVFQCLTLTFSSLSELFSEAIKRKSSAYDAYLALQASDDVTVSQAVSIVLDNVTWDDLDWKDKVSISSAVVDERQVFMEEEIVNDWVVNTLSDVISSSGGQFEKGHKQADDSVDSFVEGIVNWAAGSDSRLIWGDLLPSSNDPSVFTYDHPVSLFHDLLTKCPAQEAGSTSTSTSTTRASPVDWKLVMGALLCIKKA